MEGRIAENPTAELIREMVASGIFGALRLARDRAKIVLYFEKGHLIFAASNLRAHRLREQFEQKGINDSQLQSQVPDQELIDHLTRKGKLSAETLSAVRANQVADILRVALLWTDGTWMFDGRVRLTGEVRVEIDLSRFLFECARHLPGEFVRSRFQNSNGTYLSVASNGATGLSQAESLVLSRAATATTLSELTSIKGLKEDDVLRSVYALALAGWLERSDWPKQFGVKVAAESTAQLKRPAASPEVTKATAPTAKPSDDLADLQVLFARLRQARDHYDVLDVGRAAEPETIKNAYHALALRFHPDRFHQSAPDLRSQVESAFARIAQAYEVLSDQTQRADYDKGRTRVSQTAIRKTEAPSQSTKPAAAEPPKAEMSRAQTSFDRGMAALKHNRPDEAIRCFAEAAMLEPKQARYRAHYGQILSKQPNMRRIAEGELQAALALEPDNVSFRIMLAELYQLLNLRRRAEGEITRALALDPKNAAAQALLESLRRK
jgi:curved DNA-binding protein CbpA